MTPVEARYLLSITKARYFSAEEDKLFCPLLDHQEMMTSMPSHALQHQHANQHQFQQQHQHHYNKVDAHALAKVLAAARLNHNNNRQ